MQESDKFKKEYLYKEVFDEIEYKYCKLINKKLNNE